MDTLVLFDFSLRTTAVTLPLLVRVGILHCTWLAGKCCVFLDVWCKWDINHCLIGLNPFPLLQWECFVLCHTPHESVMTHPYSIVDASLVRPSLVLLVPTQLVQMGSSMPTVAHAVCQAKNKHSSCTIFPVWVRKSMSSQVRSPQNTLGHFTSGFTFSFPCTIP